MTRLRWKLLVTTMLVVFIPIYLLNRYALDHFHTFTRSALERHMNESMRFVEDLLLAHAETHSVDQLPETFPGLLKRYPTEAKTRIVLLNRDGQVWYDSALLLPDGTDLTGRGEIREALGGAYGARSRLNRERMLMFYYCALPVAQAPGAPPHTIIYAIRHTNPIIKALNELKDRQAAAAWLALAVAGAVAGILSWTLTWRLRRLEKAVLQYTAGEPLTSLPTSGRDEIAALARSFEKLHAELEQRTAYNQDFVNTHLHELKAPVTAIAGAAEVLDAGAADNPETRSRFVGNILHETRRLQRLVERMTELTRLDVAALAAPMKPVDLREALPGIVDRLRPTFPANAPPLTLSLPDQAVPIRGQEDRLEQVVANLLQNAFRHTPENGTVTLKLSAHDAHAHLVMTDTGAGIAAGDLPRVFDRYFTTLAKGRGADQGTGLGLSIVRTIITQHGGNVDVSSDGPGAGTTCRISLPLADT